MSEEIKYDRRRFLGSAAMSIFLTIRSRKSIKS